MANKPKYSREKTTGYYYTYIKTGFYQKNGAPEYKKIRAKTIKLLEEKEKRIKEEVSLGMDVFETKLTVEDWAKCWFSSYKSGCAESTRLSYQRLLNNHILPVIGRRRLKEVTEAQLQKLLNDLGQKHYGNQQKQYTKKTVDEVRGVLFSLFETAKANRKISVNPAGHLKISGAKSGERRELNEIERIKYLDACQNHSFGLFAAIIYYLGLRRGEALALTRGDIGENYVNIDKQYSFPTNSKPVLDTPKTDAGIRHIKIPQALKEIFEKYGVYEMEDPDDLLIYAPLGGPLSYSQFRDRWNNFIYFALGEDTDITPHSLRHNYATLLFESGVDVLTAQKYLGHESVETTMRIYTHLSEKSKRMSDNKILNI